MRNFEKRFRLGGGYQGTRWRRAGPSDRLIKISRWTHWSLVSLVHVLCPTFNTAGWCLAGGPMCRILRQIAAGIENSKSYCFSWESNTGPFAMRRSSTPMHQPTIRAVANQPVVEMVRWAVVFPTHQGSNHGARIISGFISGFPAMRFQWEETFPSTTRRFVNLKMICRLSLSEVLIRVGCACVRS